MEQVPAEIRDGTLLLRIGMKDAASTVSASGELDLANAQSLVTAIEGLERAGAAAIVVDLTELEFIDSTGIAILVAAHHRFNREDERFRLVASESKSVQRVMSLTGLDEGLPFISGTAA